MIPVEQIRKLPLDHRCTIPETFLDVMGHMNIRWYMALFNDSIPNFWHRIGIGKVYFQENQAGVFALKQHINYLAEVRVGETVAIHNRVLGRSAKRLHFIQLMINESKDKLACTMEVLNSHVDLRIRRTSPYPPQVTAQIDELLAEHQQLGWDAPICGVIEP